MNTILSKLSGNKTHLSVLAVIVYVLGGKLGFWPVDPTIVTGLFAAVLAFLRAGVAKAQAAAELEPPIGKPQ